MIFFCLLWRNDTSAKRPVTARIKKQHCSEMSPQSNSQGPLLHPGLHVADESDMATEMAELKICPCPGKATLKSKVEVKMITNNIQNSLKTPSYHFDFYVGEKYWQCFWEIFPIKKG